MLHCEGLTMVSTPWCKSQNQGSDLHLCNLYLWQVQCQRWQVRCDTKSPAVWPMLHPKFRTGLDWWTGCIYLQKSNFFYLITRLINGNGRMSMRDSEVCLSSSRNMTLLISTFQEMECSKCLCWQAVVVRHHCNTTVQKCTFRWYSWLLNHKIVSCNLRQDWKLDRVVLWAKMALCEYM